MRALTETELHFLADAHECPFCCGKTFRFGPRGAAGVNVFCANEKECGAGFNLIVTIQLLGQLIQAPQEEH